MDERHVPPIGLRYWAIFVVVSIFGGQMGDLVPMLLPFSILGRMVVVAGVLAAIFVTERFDNRSSTDAYYWLAVVVMQVAAVRLADLSALHLGMDRLELVGALILLVVTTVIVSRGDESHIIASLQLERPGAAARPIADMAHWLGMIMASILGTAASDLFAITFGVGTLLLAVLFSAAATLLLHLQRRSRPDRLHAFWLTTTVVRADGVAIGDFLVKGPHAHLGLALATALTGIVVIAAITLWPVPQSQT